MLVHVVTKLKDEGSEIGNETIQKNGGKISIDCLVFEKNGKKEIHSSFC